METITESDLRSAGLKVTSSRLAVIAALAAHPHSNAEVLRSAIGTEISVQSVHNVLADLTRTSLVRRIEPAGSAALYELRVGDNHHHVVCTSCGTVGDVDCVVGHAPCLHPSDTSGFAISAAEVTFWGLCSDCREL
jgi:Fur family ferric uptake transcriptional regulator